MVAEAGVAVEVTAVEVALAAVEVPAATVGEVRVVAPEREVEKAVPGVREAELGAAVAPGAWDHRDESEPR